jgi:hypothetical protein
VNLRNTLENIVRISREKIVARYTVYQSLLGGFVAETPNRRDHLDFAVAIKACLAASLLRQIWCAFELFYAPVYQSLLGGFVACLAASLLRRGVRRM